MVSKQSPPARNNSKIEMEEVAIALLATDFNPGMLNLDFLKFSGIIPTTWELAQSPTVSASLAQFNFSNQVNLVAQPRSVTFLEGLSGKSPPALEIPALARRYLDKLPHANYRGLNIAPRLLLGFPQHDDAARRFIVERLLAGGAWHELGQAPLRAALTLNYQLQHCQLSLAINEVRLQQAETQSVAALLFAGSFNYALAGEESAASINQLQKWLAGWHADLATFRDIVSQRFLKLPARPQPPTSTASATSDTTGSSLFPQL